MNTEHIKTIIKAAKKNYWISGKASIDDGDPFAALEYEFKESSIHECQSLQELKEKLDGSNWAIGQCFAYGDLIFINQVNGGDEWLTMKFFGDELVIFESVTFRPMIHDYQEIEGEYFHTYARNDKEPKVNCFERFIKRLQKATKEQCLKGEY